MMKSEVVLIAKFFRIFDAIEWVRHYTCLGFDHITIYDNCTECFDVSALMSIFPNLTVCKVKHVNDQCEIYNTHRQLHQEYEWQFFCDDDEFLYIDKTKFKDVNSFLSSLPPFIKQFGVYWKYMSYLNGKAPDDRMITRVTEDMVYTDNSAYFTHVKCFVHKSVPSHVCKFIVPHMIHGVPTYSVDGPIVDPAATRNPFNDYVALHHYYRRSVKETAEKMERRRIDANGKYKDHPEQNEYEKNNLYNVLDSRILQ